MQHPVGFPLAVRPLLLVLLTAAAGFAQDAGVQFFETNIRPVLVEKCYGCHSSKSRAPMGGLVLDSREGIRKGGASGPSVVPGQPAASSLLEVLRYSGSVKMPPTGKLPDRVIADFERWVEIGAPDPRQAQAAPASSGPQALSVEEGRKWWAFLPVRELPEPRVSGDGWRRTKIDSFVLAELEKNGLDPSPAADRRTLIRRAYFDLTGLPPAYEEVETFAADQSPYAWPRLVDRLLASPRYGERWGRYWLDVARWAEDNPTSEATNPPYPNAWQYRDWVIEAFNRDIPYDRFVKMQFAADLLPGFQREQMPALAYFGTGPIYHKDTRLSKEVIETLASDDWDERVDAVSRGLLGLTVACARCHDHKFDPIPNKDYYAMAGVFASMLQVERPLVPMDPVEEKRMVWVLDRIRRLDGSLKNLGGESENTPEYVEKRKAMQQELAQLRQEVQKWDGVPRTHAIYDAGHWIDGSDPNLTQHDIRLGQPRDLPVFLKGNVANPGEIVPRHFLTVLSNGEPQPFRQGSGRKELVEDIFGEAAPLAARVIVNRVWGWHFGRPLVGTPSDFGTQGEKPTHPELLDDLAARFIANGWSIKWLHREILLSATYQQASHPRPEAEKVDPTNRLVWRFGPHRLDFEAYRDALLTAAGTIDYRSGGPSQSLDDPGNRRRTVYGKISRGRLNAVLALYDFPEPTQHAPSRDITTSPTQQLFVLNSDFIQDQAEALAAAIGPGAAPDRIRALYRHVLNRDPKPKEIDLGLSFVGAAPDPAAWAEYAQALLATNEFTFLN